MDQQDSLVLGVFERPDEARHILDELRAAGFNHDDLGLALREGGAATSNLVQDLMQLGLVKEQAEFYYQEVQRGKAVASVRTTLHAQEIHELFQQFGAYDYLTSVAHARKDLSVSFSGASLQPSEVNSQSLEIFSQANVGILQSFKEMSVGEEHLYDRASQEQEASIPGK